MGLFRKSDELFELMGKGQSTHRASRPDLGTTSLGMPRPTESTGFGRRRIESSSSFGRRRADTSSTLGRLGISWGGSRKTEDVFMIDGDALVVVDDGWQLPGEGEGPSKVFPVRLDTLIVGGLVLCGMLLVTFFYGRHSGPEPSKAVASASEEPEEEAKEIEEAPEVQSEPQPQPSMAAWVSGGTDVASKPVTPAVRPEPARTLKASAPRPKGSYYLLVCSTSPANAKKVVKFLKEDPTSPIFGRSDLEPYNKGGSVRIRGFTERDKGVLRKVHATHDPLGGSGTFGDAMYLKSS